MDHVDRSKERLKGPASRRERETVEQLFAAALELAPEERTVFLERACRDSPDLEPIVHEMLDREERMGSFLEQPLFEARTAQFAPCEDAIARAATGPRWKVGDVLNDRFVIVRYIARGGMGEVYEVEDRRLQGVHVGLKTLLSQSEEDPAMQKRFEREILHAREVVHPNLCPIYDIYQTEERGRSIAFLTMKLLSGETLASRIAKQGPLDLLEAIAIIRQVGDALGAVHDAGILHRDIKASNIMLDGHGPEVRVCLMDFGLAHAYQGGASMLSTIGLAGTPAYMAPELFRGEQPSTSTDVFAIGVVAYEMLIGHVPRFTPGNELETGSDVAFDKLPAEWKTFIRGCVEADSNRRFASVRDALAVLQLRKVLDDSSAQDQSGYIENSRRGYRFIAPVTEIDPASKTARPSVVEPPTAALPMRARWWQNRWAWIALPGLALLLAGGTVLWWFKVAHPSAGQFHSLAVLPLENLSGDPDQEYFADGMTDELITDLAQIHSLRVISRTSVMQFKHTKKTLPEIAKELNVDAIVQGSVARQGNDVHITAQLLDARQDRHLWAGSYERQITDVSGLQSQITRAIADEVKASITPQEDAHLTKISPRNPDAYDALLRGRFLRARKMANTFQALPFFKQSVALDPNNAEAWEALADSYAHMGADLGADPATMRPQAIAALAKAFELDPDLAEAHATSGWVKLWYDWDWAGAEREFRRAIELSPNDSVAHRYYSHYLDFRGRFDEAIKENGRAMDLAPLDMLPQAHLAWIYKDAHMADKTIEQSKHLLEIDPNFVNGYFYLGAGYELKHQWSEANAVYEQVREKTNKGAYLLSMARLWALSGNRPQAEATWGELLKGALDAKVRIPPSTYAEFYGALGDRDKAIEQLEKAYQEHAPAMVGLKVDPYFDSLRSDPRFQDLERRVGF